MTRNSLAALVSPVFLRLVLALTFLWAGLGKVVESSEFSGEDADTLRQWDVSPSGASVAAPPKDPARPAIGDGEMDQANDLSAFVPSPSPGGMRAPRLYHIALMIERLARATPAPSDSADTSTPTAEARRILPAFAADGRTPVVLAWSAAITEIAAGVFCLIGFLTRLSALSLAGVMGTAIWLTQIGPAYASGSAVLGFLPRHETFDVAAWQPLLWQVSLLGASLALLFAGPGLVSLDRLFFHRPRSAARTAPANSANPPA